MEADAARTVLEGTAVGGWPGVYVLGCIDRRVTVYSQQVRALNLAAALRATERVKPGDLVVIVGAGAAGLTCAAGLLRLGAEVVVLETREQILPLFRGRSTRWLHPGVYDWPLEGWSRDRAGLPVMDWEHGLVDNVRAEMEAEWKRVEAQGRVSLYRGVSLVKLTPGDAPRTVTWSPRGSKRTATVILAVGFGLEPTELPMEKRYWEGDDLDAARVDGKRRRWLVSGCGDGALTDLFRLCLEGFRHDQMLRDYAQHPRMREVRDEICRIERDAVIQDDPVKLHNAYLHLDAPWVVEAMKRLPRPDTDIWLNAPTAEFLTRGASALNRFLAGQLYRAERFDFVPGKVQNAVSEGDRVVVRLEDGTSETFDRIVRRHGPVSTLTEQFPLIAKAIESDRIYRRDKPTFTDQTRTRHWIDGIFGQEVRGIPDPETPNFKAVIVDADAVGSSCESASGQSLRPNGVQDWLQHHAADLNQRANRLRASPTWLNDPEVVDVSVRERSIGEAGAGRLVRTFERALETAEPRLVLVGEGGAGKTTLLLCFAVAMAQRALEDESAPLPLYLRLNSFDAEQRSFYGLLDALEISSGLPKQALDALWRGDRPCCFLLDGLNEVHPDFRDGCLSAIEQLAPTNGRHRCIITSRLTADVDELVRRIAPATILETVPLTESQILAVLDRRGLSAVVYRLGSRLTELARTPFLLSAIVKICEEVDHAKVPLSVPQLIRTLIDDYIFERREMAKPRAVRPTTYDYIHIKRPILARVALPMVREGVTRIPEDPALLKAIRAHLQELQGEYRGMLAVMPEEPHAMRLLDEIVLNDILTRSTSRKGKTLEFLNESVLDYYAGIELSSLTAADIAALVPPLVWRRIEVGYDELPVPAKFIEAIAMHVGLDGDASQLLPLVAARHPLVAARCIGAAGLHEIPAGRALLQEWVALLRDPRPLRRWVASQCLQRTGDIDEDAGQGLAELAHSDPEPFVRLVAMHALSSCAREAPVATLIAALVAYDGISSSDPGTNLWKLRSSLAVRALVEQWSAPASSERDRARTECLLTTMDPDFVDDVLARIDGPAAEEVRRALPGWNALGYHIGFQASRMIREQERARAVAEEAGRRHRELLSADNEEELQRLLKEGNEDERGSALELLHARAALPVVRIFDVLRDPSPRVRQRAEATLRELPVAQWCEPWEERMSDGAWTVLFHVPAELEQELFFELPDRWIGEFASRGISARELGCVPAEPGWILEPVSVGGSLEKDVYRVIRVGERLAVVGASIRPRLAILGAHLGERAMPALDRFLAEEPRSARAAVVEAWGQIGTDAAIERLADQLRSEPLDWRVITALAASRHSAARTLLLDVLAATRVPAVGGDGDVENRVKELTLILIDLGATDELRRLIDVMLNSSDTKEHIVAAHMLLAHGAKKEQPFEDLAIRSCSDPDPRVRVAGVKLLATTQDAAGRAILLQVCMNEPDREVWSAACAAFRRACSDEDLRQLRQARHVPDRDMRIRVFGALALVRDDSVIADLLEALHDPDAEIRALATEGLQRLSALPPSMQRDPRDGDH
jgi:HEAT repeat protein